MIQERKSIDNVSTSNNKTKKKTEMSLHTL